MTTTHYETLGVSKTATQEEIKKAYRKLAAQHHPDKGGNTETFAKISAANNIIGDPQKRIQYDAEQASGGFRNPRSGSGRQEFRWSTGNADDMNDADSVIERLRRQFSFGQHAQRPQYQYQPTNQDVRIRMQLSAESTLAPQTRTLQIKVPGRPNLPVDLTIPAGIHHGATIKYTGLGDHSIGSAPRGDLYVEFSITLPPGYHHNGSDIYTEMSVNCIDAMIGCNKEVKGIEDKTFSVKLPAGSQHGTMLAVGGQGLIGHGGHRGRLIVVINIQIPTGLSEKQLDLLQQFNQSLATN